jgi:hypothetical protein
LTIGNDQLPPVIDRDGWDKVKEQARKFMSHVDSSYIYPCHHCGLTWHEWKWNEFRNHMRDEHGQVIAHAMKDYYKVAKL